MIITEIGDAKGLLALADEWRKLQGAVGRLPFTSFEWNVAWWNQLARRKLHVTDHLAVRTIRSDSGELVAVAPLMVTELPAHGPARFRCLQFLGADPNITEIRGMLCKAELETECYDALLRHLFERSSEWDFMLWGGIPEGGMASRFALHGSPVWLENIPYFVLDLPGTWEEFKATRPRNIKESLRKCKNSLKNAGMHASFRVAQKGTELTRALADLVRLHRERAERTDTVLHGNVFAKESARRFLSEVCERYEATGGVRVFSLDVDGRTVAARLGFTVGDSLYLSYSGYDSQFARYSVMTTVVAEAIRSSIEAGFRTVNLSSGCDVSKTRWSPRRVESRVAMMPSGAARAPLAMALYNQLRRLLAPPSRAASFPRGAGLPIAQPLFASLGASAPKTFRSWSTTSSSR